MRTLLAASISLALAANLPAAVIYSGVQNIPVPDTFDGIYLNFTDYTNPALYTTSTTAPADWDINLFFGGSAIANSDTLQPVTVAATVNSDVEKLSTGTTVSVGSLFPASFSGSTGHIGPDPDQWVNGETAYIGIRIQDSSFTSGPGFVIYGFMEVTLQDDGSPGNIIQWAWDPTGDPVLIPEPASLGLLLLGATGLLRRRRA